MNALTKNSVVTLAYYEQKDWTRFLALIDDREHVCDTWEEWHHIYERSKKDLLAEGFIVKEQKVDLDELVEYCKNHGMKNDGKARSQFVIERRVANKGRHSQ